jgi:hypothetical protein
MRRRTSTLRRRGTTTRAAPSTRFDRSPSPPLNTHARHAHDTHTHAHTRTRAHDTHDTHAHAHTRTQNTTRHDTKHIRHTTTSVGLTAGRFISCYNSRRRRKRRRRGRPRTPPSRYTRARLVRELARPTSSPLNRSRHTTHAPPHTHTHTTNDTLGHEEADQGSGAARGR